MDVKDLLKWAENKCDYVEEAKLNKDMMQIYLHGIEHSDRRLWFNKIIFENEGDSIKKGSGRYLFDLQCQYRSIDLSDTKALERMLDEVDYGRDLQLISNLETSGAEFVNDHMIEGPGIQAVSVGRPSVGRCSDTSFDCEIQLNDGREIKLFCGKADNGSWVLEFDLAGEIYKESSPDLDRLDKDIAQWISKEA